MPVIPTYESKGELDPNDRGMPRPTFSTAAADAQNDTGRAIQGLGAQITAGADRLQAAADRHQQIQDQKAKFSAGVQDDARRQELTGALADLQQKMPEDGSGFHDNFLTEADKIAEKRFAAMPPEQAQQYRERWQAERIGWSNTASQVEAKAGKAYATTKLGELQEGLVSEIQMNPTPEAADAAYKRGVERIQNAPFVTAAEKSAMLKNWETTARTAEAQTRFANDPEGARRALPIPGGAPSASSGGSPALENRAMAFFQSKGWTKAQAAGIVGNLIQESRLRTTALNPGDGSDGSNSIGIAQWNGRRAEALKQFAVAQGKSVADLDTQLAFVDHELRNSHRTAGDRLAAATDVKTAAAAIVESYERPKGSNLGAANADGWGNRLGHATRLAGGADSSVQTASVSAGDPRYASVPISERVKIQRTADANARTAKVSVANEVKDDEQSIMETGKPTPSLTPERVAATHGPEAAQNFVQNRVQAASYHAETSTWDRATNDEIQQSLTRLAPQPGQPGYASASAYLATAQKKADAILKARANDPAASVESQPEIQQLKKAVKPNDVASVQALVKARMAAQTALGLKPEPVTNAEAEQLGSVLTNALPGTERAVLGKLLPYLDKVYGEDADYVLKRALTQAGVKQDTQEVAARLFRKIHADDKPTLTDAEQLQGAQTTDAIGSAAMAATVAPVSRSALGAIPGAPSLGAQAGQAVADATREATATAPDAQKAQAIVHDDVLQGGSPLKVPDAAIVTLLQNPSKAAQFDTTFRLPPGTAEKLIKKHADMTGAK